MEIVALILLVGLGFFIYKQNSNKTTGKNSIIKKDELIQKYYNELLLLRSSCEGNEELFKLKKLEYLKKASSELHNNIFFEKDEVKKIIQDLAAF